MKFNVIMIFILCCLFALPVNAQFYNRVQSNPTNFDSYVKMLKSKIQKKALNKSFDRNYRAKIGFKLDKLGNIIDTRTLETSGSNDFDYYMTEAIIDSSPFNPLPYNFHGNEVAFIVEFIAKDVLVSCQYATTDPRVLEKERALRQQLQQAQYKRKQTQQQQQLQEQQVINQTRSTVNSVLRQFKVPTSW